MGGCMQSGHVTQSLTRDAVRRPVNGLSCMAVGLGRGESGGWGVTDADSL